MFNFLPLILVFVGLAGFIFILSRRLSQLGEEAVGDQTEPTFFTGIANKIKTLEFPREFLPYFEKSLHRARLLILKTDNSVSQWLAKIKLKNNGHGNGQNENFWEDFNKNERK